MAALTGGLYSSNEQVKRMIKLFLQVHECKHCGRFFTEQENLGAWKCVYHPGEYDYHTRDFTCCGERSRRNYGAYSQYASVMTWSEKERNNYPDLHSKGCRRCDCISKYENPIPSKVVAVADIASMIPTLKASGVPIEKRPGLVKGRNLRIERFEPLPQIFWNKNLKAMQEALK